MVIRYYINCITCDTPHTLRISVGHNTSQDHMFQCVKCEEDIKVRMDVDFKNIKTKIICIENCEIGTEEGNIINLNPEFPIPPDMLHEDHTFPWMHFVSSHFSLKDKPPTAKIGNKRFLDIHSSLGGNFAITDAWVQLKKAWSLQFNQKHDLSINFLKKYKEITGYQDDIELNQVLFHFSGALISPGKWHLFENAAEKISEIYEKHPQKFLSFRLYYEKELHRDHIEKYYEIFSHYFKYFSEYNQVLLYSKNSRPVDESFHVSSENFKQTKMFYGDSFEVLTSSFTILACLNNLSNGRKYDEFETMNLAKYITINKANRSNPFKNTDCFAIFAECIDSTIRNASHHQSMKINNKGIVAYRSPGSSNWKKIPYIKYLFMCNEIMLNICALQMIELLIVFQPEDVS